MVVTPKGIRNQAFSDLFAQFPTGEHETSHEELPCEEVCSLETKEWCFVFVCSSTHQVKGAGVVLYDPDSTNISLSFRLEFHYSNNVSEYEALIIELISGL